MITLDGGQFSDVDTLLLGALTLSAATGQPFEMRDVGKRSSTPGVTPLHLTAMRALGALVGAEVAGEAVSARTLRFRPTQPPRARDLVVDPGEATGRPSPTAVTPLIEAMIPVLARAEGGSLVRFRGTNASPERPSAFWLRETLAPMLRWLGLEVAVEIERWGWYPDGGGETTLLVEAGATPPQAPLAWDERGDPVGLWAMIALSARLEARVGQQMGEAFRSALAREPMGPLEVEVVRVRSPGPGNGLFVAAQFEHVVAGFEAVAAQGMAAAKVAEGAASALSHFFWSDAAFEPELARAMMIPLALSGQEARFTTSELTRPMEVLEALIPHFLPVTVALSKHPTGGQVTIQPRTA